MANGTAADKRLGNLIHLNGRLHSRIDALLFQRILQCQRIDHGREHAHVIGGNPVHLFRLLGHAPEKIPSAHHDRDLNPQRSHVRQFGGDFVDTKRVNAKALGRGEGLAGELEQNAFEDGSCHDFVAPASLPAVVGRPVPHKTEKKGAKKRPWIILPFWSGLVMAMVSPASPL